MLLFFCFRKGHSIFANLLAGIDSATEPAIAGKGESYLFIDTIPTDNLLSVAATEVDKSTPFLISAQADIREGGALSTEGDGRVGGHSISANLLAGIDSATGPATAGKGGSYLFIDMIPTDNLLSVAATEPTLLLPALAGNSKVGEGEGGGGCVDIIVYYYTIIILLLYYKIILL
ncbi:hypothetical protein CDIK_2218 [Cucumispora dikerogammari]|nr:hypothetical protein CDIK_2218 [Cucumispora dikerogammari]